MKRFVILAALAPLALEMLLLGALLTASVTGAMAGLEWAGTTP